MPKVFMDISPLFEPQWSGIARVTAALCRSLLHRDDVTFFYRDLALKSEMIERTMRSGSARGLEILIDRGKAVGGTLSDTHLPEGSVAIYPNLKTDRKRFARFCLVVYDLSFVLTPEFHDSAMVMGYRRHLWQNAHDASDILAISEATKRDLVAYYGVPADKIFVAPLGVDAACQRTQNNCRTSIRPFFLILGTIEPRKNIELVLDFIRANRQVLDRYDFIFVGKDGWGPAFAKLAAMRSLQDDRRVRHLGFLADDMRDALIEDCEALIFPSFFEGFGLPVLEALARGKIVLASRSSGILEAGGDHMVSFDPTNLASFSQAFVRVTSMSTSERETLTQRGRDKAQGRTWERFAAEAVKGFGLEATSSKN